jgi:hypothetical protein
MSRIVPKGKASVLTIDYVYVYNSTQAYLILLRSADNAFFLQIEGFW